MSPGYLRTLKIPVRTGRTFYETDVSADSLNAIVNTKFVKKYFGVGYPVRRRFQFGSGDAKAPFWTIMGVAADTAQEGIDSQITPFVYMAFSTTKVNRTSFYVKTAADPERIFGQVQGVGVRMGIGETGTNVSGDCSA